MRRFHLVCWYGERSSKEKEPPISKRLGGFKKAHRKSRETFSIGSSGMPRTLWNTCCLKPGKTSTLWSAISKPHTSYDLVRKTNRCEKVLRAFKFCWIFNKRLRDIGRARLPQNLRLLSEALNFCCPWLSYAKTRA